MEFVGGFACGFLCGDLESVGNFPRFTLRVAISAATQVTLEVRSECEIKLG